MRLKSRLALDMTPLIAPIDAWMQMAIDLAREAGAHNEAPIGAVLVHEGKVIGRGRNRREETQRTAAHAELEALDEFHAQFKSWRLPLGTVLVATLEPCLMCTGALLWARVDKIYYGCKDPKEAGLTHMMPAIDSGRFDHRFSIVEGGHREEECSALLKDFFKRKRASLKETP